MLFGLACRRLLLGRLIVRELVENLTTTYPCGAPIFTLGGAKTYSRSRPTSRPTILKSRLLLERPLHTKAAVAMSFFGFNTALPRDQTHNARAPGFGAAPDAFAGLSRRGVAEEGDDEEV